MTARFLAKINLVSVAGRMRQRNKHLPPALSATADVVLHNGDLARKAVQHTRSRSNIRFDV